ncbi:uncharacterized protein LOC131841057 [Achroia grisella]|uniref:uncharacterized protein LOC131841057 n=1 Tax=Achroia grisella TaxID=688607 RepID=UPI0027D2DD64|nr:uncharacterized protein LOC131841057 [Achroia grisella]
MGDFNAHPGELFETELLNFCNEQHWSCADYIKLGRCSGTFTFISDVCGGKRWLDHCIVTEAALGTVCDVEVYDDVYWSDHFPLVMHINLGVMTTNTIVRCQEWVRDPVIWGTRTVEQMDHYYQLCTESLSVINVPFEVSRCGNSICCNEEHRQAIDILYSNIISVIRKAAICSGKPGKGTRRKRGVPGWNRYVRDAHREARQAFINWKFYGQPRYGPLFVNMRQKSKFFEQKLKYCQNNAEQIKLNILSAEHKGKNFIKFWNLAKKLSPKPSVPVSVNSLSDPKDIADLFKNHFKIDPVLQSRVRSDCPGSAKSGVPVHFSTEEIKHVINSMTRGKSPGHDSLSIEHFQCAGPQLLRVLTLLYNLCVQHSYLPSALMRTIVVPIVKNKNGDLSNKDNYRPISLATIAAKVLDGILERRICKYFKCHDAQFGFQPGLSTETAIMALKKTVRYYTDRSTPVHAAFLDLSRAFDLVDYKILWSKMRRLAVPDELVNLFKYWYDHQINQVKWSGSFSEEYTLACGVRQGGLSSPALFSMYVDDLIEGLSSTGIGCSIHGTIVNSISYADDMVLLSPSISALRRLLKMCEEYAESHGLRYNVKKSEVMMFHSNNTKLRYMPALCIYGTPLNRVSRFKYLGHIVSEDLSDDSDIERERRALSVRYNVLAHRFAGSCGLGTRSGHTTLFAYNIIMGLACCLGSLDSVAYQRCLQQRG